MEKLAAIKDTQMKLKCIICTIGTEKKIKIQITTQTDLMPTMQELSSAVQIHGQKGAVQKKIAIQNAMKTQAIILISIVKPSYQ